MTTHMADFLVAVIDGTCAPGARGMYYYARDFIKGR